MSNILTESEWAKTTDVLLEGLTGTRRSNMAAYLHNTRREFLRESASPGATSSGNIAVLNKVILPLMRRVMPTVIANEIIGVQPMSGPVSQVHTLRVLYADDIPAAGGGSTLGTEVFNPSNIEAHYAGNQNPAAPGASPTASMEGTAGNRISIQMLRETVTAQTVRLQSRWTFEAQQDAAAMHGLDLESEMLAILGQEISSEIDQTILRSLRRLPSAVGGVYDQSRVSGTATFVGDEHANLTVMINRQANLIASRTRRGAGNWCVLSPTALTILQSASTSAFAPTTQGVFDAPTNSKFVGVLNNSMRVYVDSFGQDSTPILVGYKGPSETDAAAFFCPYIPLTSSGVVIDPQTFEPVVALSSRFGYVELTNTANSFGNAADYLGLIGINAATLSFL